MRHFVDRGEFHLALVQGVGEAPQHVEDFDAPHKGVGGEVDLELTVAGARRQVTDTDHFGRQSILNNGLQHNAFCQELGVDVLVSEILSIEKFLLGENVIRRHGVVDIETAGAVRGNVYQPCAGLQTEVNTTLRTTHIHIFDFSAFAEVFHHSCAVEHRVDFRLNEVGQIVGNISKDNVETVAEEFVVGGFEIVEQKGLQPVFGAIHILVAY